MTEGHIALLIPFGFFFLVGLIVWIYLRYQSINQAEFHETVRAALERGQELTPELIDTLNNTVENRDLRRGMISMGIALGFAVFGYMIPEDEALGVFLGFAAFPFFVGLAYLLLHIMSNKDEPKY